MSCWIIGYLFHCSMHAEHIRYWLPTKALNNERTDQQSMTVGAWRTWTYHTLTVADLSIHTSVLAENCVPAYDGDLVVQLNFIYIELNRT